jgi:hypothetical protein
LLPYVEIANSDRKSGCQPDAHPRHYFTVNVPSALYVIVATFVPDPAGIGGYFDLGLIVAGPYVAI